MAEINWDDTFLVGIAKIDVQHSRMTAMINKLYYAYMDGRDKKILDEIIIRMSDYANYHFQTEKQLMEEYGYPEKAGHRAEHREFMEKSVDFLLACVTGKKELTSEVLDYLMDWWVKHINGTDKKMAGYLKARGVS